MHKAKVKNAQMDRLHVLNFKQVKKSIMRSRCSHIHWTQLFELDTVNIQLNVSHHTNFVITVPAASIISSTSTAHFLQVSQSTSSRLPSIDTMRRYPVLPFSRSPY